MVSGVSSGVVQSACAAFDALKKAIATMVEEAMKRIFMPSLNAAPRPNDAMARNLQIPCGFKRCGSNRVNARSHA